MSSLSLVRNDQKAVPLLATIYPLSETATSLVFDVLETDAYLLKEELGKLNLYVLEDQTFWGELTALETARSEHHALGLLRDRPSLRGTFAKFSDEVAIGRA